MDYKETNAAVTTVTYNKDVIENPTENIYEAISIIAKRAEQINSDLKKELVDKLDEFATYNDSLEEVFENKEQIEVSKFYEKLPKPTAIAVETDTETVTYQKINEKAESFKALLLQKKVAKGDVIAVSLPQSIELLYD